MCSRMGNVRVLVEASFRDISTLLNRARVSLSTQREVQHRFLRLLRDLQLSDYDFHPTSAGRGPGVAICNDIVRDVVGRVVDVFIPKRQANMMEIKAHERTLEMHEQRQQLTELEARLEYVTGAVNRRDEAHRQLMSSYFREVMLLRRDRETLSREREVYATAFAMANAPGIVVQLASSVAAGGSIESQSARPASIMPSPRIPLLRAGSAGSRIETPLNTLPPSGTSSHHQPRDGVLTVTPSPLNPQAIFDYDAYLQQLAGSDNTDLQSRHSALLAEYGEFVAKSSQYHEATVAHYRDQISSRDTKIGHLTAMRNRMRDLLSKINTHVLPTMKSDFAKIREDVVALMQRVQQRVALTSLTVNETLATLRQREDLFLEYVAKGAKLIVAEAGIEFSSIDDTKVRQEFQTMLHPAANDSQAMRSSKLLLRRHDVTGSLLAAIIAVKRGVGYNKELAQRVRLLGAYALKESAERLRTAKILNDLRVQKADDDKFQLASIADAARLSGDYRFIERIFAAAEDPDFEMSDMERTLIFAMSKRHNGRLRDRVMAVFRRVREKTILSRIRYIFELSNGAAERVYEGLPTVTDVKEHLALLIERRHARILRWTSMQDQLRDEAVADSTRLITSLSAELLWRVLRSIRRRSQILLDKPFEEERREEEPKTDTEPPKARTPAPPEPSNTSANRHAPRPSSMRKPSRPLDTSTHLSHASKSDTDGIALKRRIDELEKEIAELRRQLDALMQTRGVQGCEPDEEVGFRIVPAPMHRHDERIVPTLGGIGTVDLQKRSICVLINSPRPSTGPRDTAKVRAYYS